MEETEKEIECPKCRKIYPAHKHKECFCAGRSECHICGWADGPYGKWSKCDNWDCEG